MTPGFLKKGPITIGITSGASTPDRYRYLTKWDIEGDQWIKLGYVKTGLIVLFIFTFDLSVTCMHSFSDCFFLPPFPINILITISVSAPILLYEDSHLFLFIILWWFLFISNSLLLFYLSSPPLPFHLPLIPFHPFLSFSFYSLDSTRSFSFCSHFITFFFFRSH